MPLEDEDGYLGTEYPDVTLFILNYVNGFILGYTSENQILNADPAWFMRGLFLFIGPTVFIPDGYVSVWISTGSVLIGTYVHIGYGYIENGLFMHNIGPYIDQYRMNKSVQNKHS